MENFIDKGDLTLEQQFLLKVLKEDISNCTEEQAKEYLVELIRQQTVKDNLLSIMLRSA